MVHSGAPAGRMGKKSPDFSMKKLFALLHLLIVILIVGFGTWQLFVGNLGAGLSTFPFLIVYYLFLTNRRSRG